MTPGMSASRIISSTRKSSIPLLCCSFHYFLFHCLTVLANGNSEISTQSSTSLSQIVYLNVSRDSHCGTRNDLHVTMALNSNMSLSRFVHYVCVVPPSHTIVLTPKPCLPNPMSFNHKLQIHIRPSGGQTTSTRIYSDINEETVVLGDFLMWKQFPNIWKVSNYLQWKINISFQCQQTLMLPQDDNEKLEIFSFRSRQLLQVTSDSPLNNSTTPGTSTSTIIIAVVVPIVVILLLICAAVGLYFWLKKRQGAGVYNPEKQEQQRGQTDINLSKGLTIPPRERLI